MSKANKLNKDLMQLDFYEILHISIEASENEIKKSFRKAALQCHPDKNPDKPEAAEEFNQLKKILEVLLDPGTRAAYDRVLKGRKFADIRRRETSAKTQKLRTELDRREQEAANRGYGSGLTDAQRLQRELMRLSDEGERLIQEEIEAINKEARREADAAAARLNGEKKSSNVKATDGAGMRVKVRWSTPDETAIHYTQEQIRTLFYKWGEINAIVLKIKGHKGTALVDYKEKSGAEMAVQYEKGLPECPMTVSFLKCETPKDDPSCNKPSANNSTEATEIDAKEKNPSTQTKHDYETLADMEKRRKNERARLIAEILRSDGVEDY